jgi:hypothetical protein
MKNVDLGIKFMMNHVKEGKFGSTQSTILALKALVEYAAHYAGIRADGGMTATFDDHRVFIPFSNQTRNAIDFSDELNSYIKLKNYKAGDDFHLSLDLISYHGEKPSKIGCSLDATTYQIQAPASPTNSSISFEVTHEDLKLDKPKADAPKKSIEYKVTLKNTDEFNVQGMAVAVIEVPSCLEIDFNFLDDLSKSKKVAHYEVLNHNSQIVLYWVALDKEEEKVVKLNLLQKFSGETCVENHHSGYLYYDDDKKMWN